MRNNERELHICSISLEVILCLWIYWNGENAITFAVSLTCSLFNEFILIITDLFLIRRKIAVVEDEMKECDAQEKR